jgi:thioesterase DpgC
VEGTASTKTKIVSSRVFAKLLSDAGLSPRASLAWLERRPRVTGSFQRDVAASSKFWRGGTDLVSNLPQKTARTPKQQAATELILRIGRESREMLLERHAETIYRELTNNFAKFVRVDELAYDAAKLVTGLTPTHKQIEAENSRTQSEKDGLEIDQGILLAHFLARPECGTHLCQAMLRPKQESIQRLADFTRKGVVNFGAAQLERHGKAAVVTLKNPRYLNAEDETTIDDTETAIDIAILDPLSQACVLRGDVVEHPNYRGRRIFSAGINLTHLYRGKIPYLWYIRRDMGAVNKILRGVASLDMRPYGACGGTIEKPWIAQLDVFAIGGGCQYLLVMDYVVAGSDAYMTLPARKEGIIPGAANLRLTRFVGPRIARQAIMVGRRLDCATPEGRMICDKVVPPGDMDRAIEQAVEDFTGSGVVSAVGNRRAFRVAEEPLDDFRRYMAVYCREQAYCHFSPALIANLEQHWNAERRTL